jgi:hypothetical protein
MSTRILLVFREQETLTLDTVRRILEKGLAQHLPNAVEDIDYDWATNEKQAKERARKDDLIVTHLHIPATSSSPLNEAEKRGLGLLQSLEKEEKMAAGILVLPAFESEVQYEIEKLRNCSICVIEPGKWEDGLVQLALKKLAPRQPEKLMGNVDIVFDIKRDELGSSKLEGSYKLGIGVDYGDYRPLFIDTEKLMDLRNNIVPVLGEAPKWEGLWKQIGKDLMKAIFYSNIGRNNFYENFRELLDKVGLENTRIRFVVTKEIHPLPLEALVHIDKYLMLEAPIYRRLKVGGLTRVRPLFCDEETRTRNIRCLIIESASQGIVPNMTDENGGDLRLPNINDHVSEESEGWRITYARAESPSRSERLREFPVIKKKFTSMKMEKKLNTTDS